MSLKDAFPGGQFRDPASRVTIQNVEAKLGVKFPEALVSVYLECDGFNEPQGNATYLRPLDLHDATWSLVSTTKFWWEEWPKIMQNPPDLKPYVFFGNSSGDEAWGIRCEPPYDIVAYHHHMGHEIEEVGQDILELYLADIKLYEN